MSSHGTFLLSGMCLPDYKADTPVVQLKRGDLLKWLNPRRKWKGLKAYSRKNIKLGPNREALNAEVFDAIKAQTYAKYVKGETEAGANGGETTGGGSEATGTKKKGKAKKTVNRGPAFVKQKNSSLLKRDDMNGVNVLSDFWTAAFYGTQTEVDRYIEAGQDVNEPNFLAPHDTALHNAAAGRSVELVKHLVETRGAKVEILDSNQNTPLHSAARAGDVSVVKYLLQNQSASMEQDAVNQLGLTPWGVAYKFGNHDACKVLPKPTDMAMGKLKLAFKMQRSQIFQSAARPSSSGGYDPLRPKSPFGVELDVGSESTKTAVHKMAMF